MVTIKYPEFARGRGPGYWLKFGNLWAGRRKMFRSDHSNQWRYSFGTPVPAERSVPFSGLLPPGKSGREGFRFLIIGDTGEGDRSQYGFLPVIRALKPDFMIINGDIAYPAGRIKDRDRNGDDYLAGFFEPYKNLNIPIWSVPGNHEYYAEGQGREYYETFCTRKYAGRWSEYGLRFVQQPGTYWELKEEGRDIPLTVIGIDTGKSGNLDGKPKTWLRRADPDDKQHSWLERRLDAADREGRKAIILFHIPALSRETNIGSVHLRKLHQIISSHECVRLVVCGHDHNYQGYSPGVFAKYMEDDFGKQRHVSDSIVYIVTGGGGAYLTSTDFESSFVDPLHRKRRYRADTLYPSPEQWNSYAKIGRKLIDRLGMSKSFLSKIIGMTEKDSLSDMDAAQYLNLLLVDVKKEDAASGFSTLVTPVFLDNLKDLFADITGDAILDIRDENLPIDQARFERCLKNELAFRL